jgi:hypothetical protein
MASPPYAEIDLSRIYNAEEHVTREDVKHSASTLPFGELSESALGGGSFNATERTSAVHMGQLRHVVERMYTRGFWRGLLSGGVCLALLFVIFFSTRLYTPEGTLVHWLQSEYVGGSWSLSFLLAGLLCFAFSPVFLSSRLAVDEASYPTSEVVPGEEGIAGGEKDVAGRLEERSEKEAIGGVEGAEGEKRRMMRRGAGYHTGVLKQLIEREARRGFWRGVLTACLCLSLVVLVSWCYGLFSIMHNMA